MSIVRVYPGMHVKLTVNYEGQRLGRRALVAGHVDCTGQAEDSINFLKT